MSTTRFPSGVTNQVITNVLGGMGQLDPTKYITYFDDFVGKSISNGTTTAVAGYGGLATAATTITVGTPVAAFLLNPSKAAFCTIQAALATVAANTMVFGFIGSAKGIFITLTGGTSLQISIVGAATTSVTYTVSYADAQMVQAGFCYLPGKGVQVYFNGVLIGIVTDMTNFDSTDNLAFSFTPTGATATIDYLFAAQER